MKRGFICVILKARCNRHSGLGNGLLDQTKEPMSLSKFKVILFVFFDRKVIIFHEFFITLSAGKQRFVPGNCSAFEGYCAQEES